MSIAQLWFPEMKLVLFISTVNASLWSIQTLDVLNGMDQRHYNSKMATFEMNVCTSFVAFHRNVVKNWRCVTKLCRPNQINSTTTLLKPLVWVIGASADISKVWNQTENSLFRILSRNKCVQAFSYTFTCILLEQWTYYFGCVNKNWSKPQTNPFENTTQMLRRCIINSISIFDAHIIKDLQFICLKNTFLRSLMNELMLKFMMWQTQLWV